MKNEKFVFMMLLMMQCMYVVALDAQGQNELNKLLIEAAKDGDIARAQSLLDQGAQINEGYTQSFGESPKITYKELALHEAIAANKPDMVKFLLNKGADFRLHANLGSVFDVVSHPPTNISILKVLLEHGVADDYNYNQDSLSRDFMQNAADRGDLDAMVELLKRGVNINLKNSEMKTLFQKVVKLYLSNIGEHEENLAKQQLKSIDFLLRRGADIPEDLQPGHKDFDKLPSRLQEVLQREIQRRDALAHEAYKKVWSKKQELTKNERARKAIRGAWDPLNHEVAQYLGVGTPVEQKQKKTEAQIKISKNYKGYRDRKVAVSLKQERDQAAQRNQAAQETIVRVGKGYLARKEASNSTAENQWMTEFKGV
jgi:hypothetical protein